MTFIVDGTSGLTFPNSTVQASSGVVLQVVQGTSTTSTSTSSASVITSNLTATITPKFATSKILVSLSATGRTSNNGWMQLVLYKNGAAWVQLTPGLHYAISGPSGVTTLFNYSYLDSPATTSAITYALYFGSGSGTVTINPDSNTMTLILMEIAG